MSTPAFPQDAVTISDGALLAIEVAYAEPEQQFLLALKVVPGCSALKAIEQSGLLAKVPELHAQAQAQTLALGVFSKPVRSDYCVQAGDRIEIYRPLIADPKQSRRKRAAKKKGPTKK